MRIAIAIGQTRGERWTRVHGMIDDVERLRLHVADRTANGWAFPAEHVVRLPRRLSRQLHHVHDWSLEFRLTAILQGEPHRPTPLSVADPRPTR